MSDDDGLTLGERRPVDGAPLARVSSRLTWPKERSEVDRIEGETVIRTPDGPRTISEILEDVEETYFSTGREFETNVRAVIGTGPIPTE